MMNYLKIIRPINVLMVIITQLLFYLYFIVPYLQQSGITPTLSYIQVFLFTICTACMVAGANVINDIFDTEIDKINKPKKHYVDLIGKKNTKIFYCIMSLTGLVIAIYLALSIKKLHLLIIYPVVVFVLFYYSKSLKGMPLLGNVIVALFTALVIGILPVAEPKLFEVSSNGITLLFGFSMLTLLANFCRELIKDIEDIEGDRFSGLSTAPIVFGVQKSKYIVIAVLVLLIALIAWFVLSNEAMHDFRAEVFAFVFLIGLSLLTITKVLKAQEKFHYSRISQLLKLLMLSGLVYAFILINNLI